MLTEPKFKRPVKTANGWPGVTCVNLNIPGVTIQYPWRFHCPQPLCFYVIHAATEEIIVQRIEKHPCPWYGGGTTTFSWGTMSDDYLTRIWTLLDEKMDVVYDESQDSPVRLAAREMSRGIAYSLAILMPPFFTTAGEIITEAKVRRERRLAGQEYETPGLGRFKFQRPPGLVGDPNHPSWMPEHDPSAEKPAPAHSLTDKEIDAIKASKAFPVKMLASAYNTTEAVIKYILAN